MCLFLEISYSLAIRHAVGNGGRRGWLQWPEPIVQLPASCAAAVGSAGTTGAEGDSQSSALGWAGGAEEGALSACAPPWVCVWVLCTVLLWDMVIG